MPTARKPEIAQTAPAVAPDLTGGLPYQWTLGNARRGYQDMVAEFGRNGLKPGQYLWAKSVPAEGDTRSSSIACCRRPMSIAATSWSARPPFRPRSGATSRRLANGRSSRSGRSTDRRNMTMRRCRGCSASTNMESRFTAAGRPASRKPRLHPFADEVCREALRPDQGRIEGRHRRLTSGLGRLSARGPECGRQGERGQQPRLVVLEHQLAVVEVGDRFGQREAQPGAFVGPARIQPPEAAQASPRSRSGMPGPRSATSIRTWLRAGARDRESRRLTRRSGWHSQAGC